LLAVGEGLRQKSGSTAADALLWPVKITKYWWAVKGRQVGIPGRCTKLRRSPSGSTMRTRRGSCEGL